MRLNPVIPLVGRVVERPTRVAGHDLPAGTPLVCSIYLAQRRAEVYPDPTRFDPTRFLGKKVARMLERADLRLTPRGAIAVQRRSITLMPSDGLLVRVDRVDGAAA